LAGNCSIADTDPFAVSNDLANAGAASELTAPFNDRSTATSTWTASAQQTPLSQNISARDMDEDDMDDSESAHPTPVNECPTIAVDSPIPSPPTHGATQYDDCAADWTAEQTSAHDFDDTCSVASSHHMEANGEEYHPDVSPDVATSMSPAFVRPHDLNALSPALQAPPTTLLGGTSPADALEIPDDDEDDEEEEEEDEADDEINLGQDDNSRHVDSADQGLMERSGQGPSSARLPHRFSPGEDAHTTLITPSWTSDIPDTGPSPDQGIKAGASPPLDQSTSSISPALDLNDLDSEAAADMMRKLMSKLDGKQLDELLRGYKPSEVPGKAKKPTPAQGQRSGSTVKCTHPSCEKVFQRTSEMK
jgi:ribosomal protein L12E/L44/L45/RPP1/RPP2